MSDRLRKAEAAAGLAGPELVVGPLTRSDFVRYAGASGDFNPMHHDDTFAEKAGLPSVFGHGMYTAGVASRAVAEWVGVENVREYGARFTQRVWPDDVLTCAVTVVGVDGDEVSLEASVTNQDGVVVLTGTAKAILPD